MFTQKMVMTKYELKLGKNRLNYLHYGAFYEMKIANKYKENIKTFASIVLSTRQC